MATLTRLLSYEEWLHMPPVEDGKDEVVNGELRLMRPTHYPHAEIFSDCSNDFPSSFLRSRLPFSGQTSA